LHVCPEAAAGGTLDIVKTGDIIKLDVKQRLLELKLSDEEIAIRKKSKKVIQKLKEGGTIKYSMKVYFKQIKGLILIS
jgi:dihydroxy-acid dehydratase